MTENNAKWDGEVVRRWLESRFKASLDEQARADRKGRGYEDEYDKAAAEEWVCRQMQTSATTDDPQRFAAFLKDLLGQEEYRRTGVHDDRRFEREVRSYLRKVIKMTKANTGFENISRFQ